MKDGVFAVLEKKWPNVRLHVTNLDRNCYDDSGVDYIPMGIRLLMANQLYSLNHAIYGV